jgi:Domain of unknown function (DUF4350)
MKKISRNKWLAGMAIAVMVLLTFIVPPTRKLITDGSTYSRTPSGYAGWYSYMETQGVKISRWQKNFEALTKSSKFPITLIRIYPELSLVGADEQDWVAKGNHLILLGMRAAASEANFSSVLVSEFGDVKIDTTRRFKYELPKLQGEKLALNIDLDKDLGFPSPTSFDFASSSPLVSKSMASRSHEFMSKQQKILSDRFGSIIWKSEEPKKGSIITATTPYLAANAYQDQTGNYKLLASLATAHKTPIYVDEFIHGYKDKDAEEKTETEKDLITYLMATPLFAAAAQALIVLLVFIFAQSRRLGAAIAPEIPSVNNSQAYIEALSSVLQKSQRHEFVWKAIAKAEQQKLQQKLGIGRKEDREILITAWATQTGRPESELRELLEPKSTEQELITWLSNWQQMMASLP